MVIIKMKLLLFLLILETIECTKEYFAHYMNSIMNDEIWNDTIKAFEFDLFNTCGGDDYLIEFDMRDYISVYREKFDFLYPGLTKGIFVYISTV